MELFGRLWPDIRLEKGIRAFIPAGIPWAGEGLRVLLQ